MPDVQFSLQGILKILVEQPPEPAAGYALITLRYGGFSVTARGDGMAYNLPDAYEIKVQVSYVDAEGNPAVVDGQVAWESSDTAIVTVTVDGADSSNATVSATGTLGQTQVTATADADMGAGVRNIITTMDITVVAGEAVAGTITPVGSATPIP
jgi:hypothetical protein